MSGPRIARIDTLHSGWGRFLKVHVALPDGREVGREVEDHGEAVVVFAYDPDRRTAVLVRQLRAPMLLAAGEASTLEAVAGGLEAGESPAECARREAEEEAGLRIGDLDFAGLVQTMPGISTERIHLFFASYGEADRIGPGGGVADEVEEIEVVELPLTTLAAMADAGELVDAKTLILLQTLRLRRPELFAG